MKENEEVSSSETTAQSPAVVSEKHDSTPATIPFNHNNLNGLDIFDEKQVLAAENFLTKIMRSEKGGIKSVNDGLAILLRAKDLNLPFSTCIEHVHVINGKTGTDIHVIKALLLRAGCTWRCTKDYQPLYEYTDGINVYVDGSLPEDAVRCKSQKEAEELAEKDVNNEHWYFYPVRFYKDIQGNVYRDYQLNTKQFGIAVNKAQMAKINSEGRIPVWRVPAVPNDYVMEYELKRKVNGKEMTVIGRFTYNDAMVAGLFEKDTYKKYPRILIGHRAFTYAARDIASDVLFGVMETTELKISSGIDLDDNDVIEIEDAQVLN